MLKTLITGAKPMCTYIQNHHATMALYHHYSPMLSLKVPPETKFVCNFLMIAGRLKDGNASGVESH
jgi:hypothetical protein